MTEIQQLIRFLETGNRKEISLFEYISIQQRKNTWSKARYQRLLAELSRSRAFPPNYQKDQNGQLVRILKLRIAS